MGNQGSGFSVSRWPPSILTFVCGNCTCPIKVSGQKALLSLPLRSSCCAICIPCSVSFYKDRYMKYQVKTCLCLVSLTSTWICCHRSSGVTGFNTRRSETHGILIARKCNPGILYQMVVLFKYKGNNWFWMFKDKGMLFPWELLEKSTMGQTSVNHVLL